MAGSTRPGQFRTDRHLPLWDNTRRFRGAWGTGSSAPIPAVRGTAIEPPDHRETVNADSDLEPTSLL